MRIVVVSDTHNAHAALGTLQGDLLIHCGDGTLGGGAASREIEHLDAWFAMQQFRAVVCIAGNHDFEVQERAAQGRPVFRQAHYLQDEAFEFGGLKVYGTPWVPELSGWAFHADGPALQRRWRAIPADTDILVTHTPPRGILDRNSAGKACGCPALLDRLKTLQPTLHCFGHIHASAGMLDAGSTRYVNAALVNRAFQVTRSPYEIEL